MKFRAWLVLVVLGVMGVLSWLSFSGWFGSNDDVSPSSQLTQESGFQSVELTEPRRDRSTVGRRQAELSERRRKAREIVSRDTLVRWQELCGSQDPRTPYLLPMVFEEWVARNPAEVSRNIDEIQASIALSRFGGIELRIPDLDAHRAGDLWGLEADKQSSAAWRSIILLSLSKTSPKEALDFMRSRDLGNIPPDVEVALAARMAEEGLASEEYSWPMTVRFWEGTGAGLCRRLYATSNSTEILATIESLKVEERGAVVESFLSGMRAGPVPGRTLLECAAEAMDLAFSNDETRYHSAVDLLIYKYTFSGGNLEDVLEQAQHNGQWTVAVSEKYAAIDPEKGTQLIESLASGPTKNEAISGFVNAWLKEDSFAAGEWVGKLDPGPERDVAIVDLAEFLIAKDDTEGLEKWVEQISDPVLREKTLLRIPGDR